MKHVSEYRDPSRVMRLAERLAETAVHPWTIMEVCGGQTHSVLRFGLDQLLPPGLTLVHGPGCPVCVTPVALIEHALQIAARPEVILASFGDMLRVPGSSGCLRDARARGADVRVVSAPLDAIALAEAAPDRQIVFFGVGFETTAPALAIALIEARRRGLSNFSRSPGAWANPSSSPALNQSICSMDCSPPSPSSRPARRVRRTPTPAPWPWTATPTPSR